MKRLPYMINGCTLNNETNFSHDILSEVIRLELFNKISPITAITENARPTSPRA